MIDDWSTDPADAAAHFSRRLAVETDVSDVHAALDSGNPGFVLLDSRSAEAWAQGRVPGALHLPGREIALRAEAELDRSVPVVTYCWGPGFEYWTREGLPVETAAGVHRATPDPLTVPAAALSCGC